MPTWNYEVVHVHVCLTVMDEEKFVRGVVARTLIAKGVDGLGKAMRERFGD